MLTFLNRTHETRRLRKQFHSEEMRLVCLYGRRRTGKTRLLREATKGLSHVYFTADEREAVLQRASLAAQMASVVPGFDRVQYPGWDELFERWFASEATRPVLVIDEFPYLVAQSPELPSVLQKHIDRRLGASHLALLGSSQRMMLGLLLDAKAPLYGRADELIKLEPLNVFEACGAFHAPAHEAIEQYAVWGGIPRYWELALEHKNLWAAVTELVLDPRGILHAEPERLLEDDLSDIAQASSILGLIGAGCHRLSEIAARLGKPSTALTRPMDRLIQMGLVHREIPFGSLERKSKRSLYRIADPFLCFWYRYVAPNRSRLGAGEVRRVRSEIQKDFPHHLGFIWESTVRSALVQRKWLRTEWTRAARYWGPLERGASGELDAVAESADDPRVALVAEMKVSCKESDVARLLKRMDDVASRCPPLTAKTVHACLFVLRPPPNFSHPRVFSAADVVRALRRS